MFRSSTYQRCGLRLWYLTCALLSQQQKGFLSTIAAPVFSFYPAHTFGSAEDIADWQKKADVSYAVDSNMSTIPILQKGLSKQYELNKRWLADEKQAQVEYGSFYETPFFCY